MIINLIEQPSPNFDSRQADSITMLVIHYTGMISTAAALDRLGDPAAKVSAHYLIDEDGVTYRLVQEKHRAWHAGISHWRGVSDVNGCSIGIELVNPGHELGYRPFPEAQMTALETLALSILDRHPIPPKNVVGHSDIAPARKMDPGELFDWRRLADRGIGSWPEAPSGNSIEIANAGEIGGLLKDAGYDTSDLNSAIAAFQRHFHNDRNDGIADTQTFKLAKKLIEIWD